VEADFADGVRIWLVVQIEDGPPRARTRTVNVSSDQKGGVSSTTLRQVPIREIVAEGCLHALHRRQAQPDGTIALVRFNQQGTADMDEVARIVQELVGYVELRGQEVNVEVTK
jgi:hypothetical protein